MENIKLVLVDIDGTLLNDEGKVTEKTIKVIERLKQKDILFGIATGRTPFAVQYLLNDWGIASYVDIILGFNGGCYLDRRTHEIKSFDLLEGKNIPIIFEDFKDYKFNAGIYDGESFHVLRDDERVQKIAKSNKLPLIIDDLNQYTHKSIEKMLFIAEPKEIDRMNEYSHTLTNKDYKTVKSTPILLEFLNPILSKSRGIHYVLKDLSIESENVITFGDELNDFEMIRDFNGVAMENANPKIKEIAKYQTKSNNEDGIAYFLEKYILEK